MKNKPDKEIQNFLNLFSDKSAEPDLEYKYKLKKSFLKEYNKKPTLFGLRLSFLVLFSAALLVGIFAFSFLPSRQSNTTVSLNSVKKQEVLEKVVKNNGINILKQVEEAVRVPLNNEAVIAKAMDLSIGQEYTSDFSQNRVLMVEGEKYSQCLEEGNIIAQTDYFNYTEGNNVFSKVVSTDEEGELVRYVLTKKFDDKTEVIFYEGGEEAVMVTQQNKVAPSLISYPASFPTSYPSEETYNEWFRENTEVLSTKINGLEYYIIQSQVEDLCTDTDAISYLNFLVNPTTFNIEKTERYLGAVEESNLIYSITNTEVNADEDTDINEIFTFEYEVNIRKLNLSDLKDFFIEKDGEVKGIFSYPIDTP